jgi:glucose-1-phosphate cytidylyltransferase
MAQRQLLAYRNRGFWACLDTFKEKKMFDDMVAQGVMPWAVWNNVHARTPRLGFEPVIA